MGFSTLFRTWPLRRQNFGALYFQYDYGNILISAYEQKMRIPDYKYESHATFDGLISLFGYEYSKTKNFPPKVLTFALLVFSHFYFGEEIPVSFCVWMLWLKHLGSYSTATKPRAANSFVIPMIVTKVDDASQRKSHLKVTYLASVSSFPSTSGAIVTATLTEGKILFPFLGLNFFLWNDKR